MKKNNEDEFDVIDEYQSIDKVYLPKIKDCSDLQEIRRLQGYEKTLLLNPYFYTLDCATPFVEIYLYEKEDYSICELWDYNGCLFCFHCFTQQKKLSCLMQYLEFAKNMVFIEQSLRKLNIDSRND